MKEPLKKAAKRYFEQPQLDSQQQRALEKLFEASPHTDDSCRGRGLRESRVGIALILLIAVLTVFFVLPNPASVRRVAMEVADNHRDLKPLSQRMESFEQARSFFSELEFEVSAPALLDQNRWQLLGGRYCSLNGIKAVQLRVRDRSDNSEQSLYQVAYAPAYFREIPKLGENQVPAEIDIDGLRVRIWSEGGIIYSLTERPRSFGD